jgi:nucleoside-diphosphate-sugar epimerase
MNILVTGGCGYVGSVLVPRLINAGHNVRVVDTEWFGNYLNPLPSLEFIKKPFAEIKASELKNIDTVIHLANIANDPSVDLMPTFSWETNVLHTTQLLELCKNSPSIKKFIYASSGSVYGVKIEPSVTEDLSLVPISTYNKTKMSAERVCLSYANYFDIYCVRPATVCGLSPRMRFDVVVNMFVLQAFLNKKITVLGGDQIRPNIHIDDMASVYLHLTSSVGIPTGTYNAGFENISVLDIAKNVSKVLNAEIELKDSNDPRSYRQDSNKLLATGFKPSKSVIDAITEIAKALQDKQVTDNEKWHTVSWMKKMKIGEVF